MAGEKRKRPLEEGGESKRARSASLQELNDGLIGMILSRLQFKNLCKFRWVSRSYYDMLTSAEFLWQYWAAGNTPGLLGIFQTSLPYGSSSLRKPHFTPLDREDVIPALRHDLRLDSIPPGRIHVCDCRLGWLLLLDRHRPTSDAPRTLAFTVYNPLWPSGPISLPALVHDQTEHIKAYGILPEVATSTKFRVFAVIRSGPMLLQLRVLCSGGDGWSPSTSFEIHTPDQYNVNRSPVLYGDILYLLVSRSDVLRVDLGGSRLSAFPTPNVHVLGDQYVWGTENNEMSLAHSGEQFYYAAVYNLTLFLWTATHLDDEAPIWSEPAGIDLRPYVHPAVVQFFNTNTAAAFSNLSCILSFAERAHVLILKLGTEVYFYHLRTSLLERSPAQPIIPQSPGVAYETGILFHIS